MQLLTLSILILLLLHVEPTHATETPSPIEVELQSTLQGVVTSCKSTVDPNVCILEKLEKKRKLYELFLEKTAPAAWSEVDVISFIFFHVSQQIAKEQIRCSSLESSAKQSCVEQIPTVIPDAKEEARHFLIGKGEAYGKREAAELKERKSQQTGDHARVQRNYEQELAQQHEHEKELARIQALGMILGNSGLFRAPQSQLYTPPPPIPAPEIPKTRNCTSSVIGNQVYTNCY